MRLPVDRRAAQLTPGRIALATAVSGAALMAALPLHASHLPPAPKVPEADRPAVTGPAADYPVVVGQPYKVGDTLFTPVNVMNFDSVGYASVGGPNVGVSAAHHTLPLPSYVEVTSLASGRTILVRVERRGPMDSTHAIELSPAAAQQLGVGSDAAVRVRRVNPSEAERALLRLGHTAPERMATPKSLLAVLQRRLATDPAASHAGASLAQAVLVPAAEKDDDDTPPQRPAPAAKPAAQRLAKAAPPPHIDTRSVVPMVTPVPKAAAAKTAAPRAGASFAEAFAPQAAYHAQEAGQPQPALKPAVKAPAHLAAAAKPTAPKPQARPALALEARAAPAPVAGGSFVVQVGAFGDHARAQAVATRVGARLSSAGNLWRVRMGPYSAQSDAQAALAKARAAGYTEARLQHAE